LFFEALEQLLQSHPHPNTDFVILIDSHDLLLDDLPYIFEGFRIGSFIHDLVFRIEYELVILLLVLPILLIFIIVVVIIIVIIITDDIGNDACRPQQQQQQLY